MSVCPHRGHVCPRVPGAPISGHGPPDHRRGAHGAACTQLARSFRPTRLLSWERVIGSWLEPDAELGGGVVPRKKAPRYRRADNGRYTTKEYAKKHPKTTVRESK
jgi:hypothetical protein